MKGNFAQSVTNYVESFLNSESNEPLTATVLLERFVALRRTGCAVMQLTDCFIEDVAESAEDVAGGEIDEQLRVAMWQLPRLIGDLVAEFPGGRSSFNGRIYHGPHRCYCGEKHRN